jgi:hypothetical protein
LLICSDCVCSFEWNWGLADVGRKIIRLDIAVGNGLKVCQLLIWSSNTANLNRAFSAVWSVS